MDSFSGYSAACVKSFDNKRRYGDREKIFGDTIEFGSRFQAAGSEVQVLALSLIDDLVSIGEFDLEFSWYEWVIKEP